MLKKNVYLNNIMNNLKTFYNLRRYKVLQFF